MPHDLPNQPQKLACGYALGERYMDCCAAGTPCTTRGEVCLVVIGRVLECLHTCCV